MQERIDILGVASGFCGSLKGSKWAPEILRSQLSGRLKWHDFINEDHFPHDWPFKKILKLSQALSEAVYHLVSKDRKTLVLGGDHSIAIGTWKGIMKAKMSHGDIGLLWVDAHMDSHTPQTSETSHIHGMPLAILLGHGENGLTSMCSSTKLKPENVCLIGIRSYESGEYDLIKKLGVKVYFIEEVLKRGFVHVLDEAITRVSKNTVGLGLSLDLDFLDPSIAPGVSTPVKNGVFLEECLEGLKLFSRSFDLIATEIVEYNPDLDENHITITSVKKIIKTIYPEFFNEI